MTGQEKGDLLIQGTV